MLCKVFEIAILLLILVNFTLASQSSENEKSANLLASAVPELFVAIKDGNISAIQRIIHVEANSGWCDAVLKCEKCITAFSISPIEFAIISQAGDARKLKATLNVLIYHLSAKKKEEMLLRDESGFSPFMWYIGLATDINNCCCSENQAKNIPQAKMKNSCKNCDTLVCRLLNCTKIENGKPICCKCLSFLKLNDEMILKIKAEAIIIRNGNIIQSK